MFHTANALTQSCDFLHISLMLCGFWVSRLRKVQRRHRPVTLIADAPTAKGLTSRRGLLSNHNAFHGSGRFADKRSPSLAFM